MICDCLPTVGVLRVIDLSSLAEISKVFKSRKIYLPTGRYFRRARRAGTDK
jgi:hypothetical protein